MGEWNEIVGSFLVGFGIRGVVWFIRRFFRSSSETDQRTKSVEKGIILILSLIAVAGGWFVYSRFEGIPLGGLALGLVLGIRVMINEAKGWTIKR